MYTTIELSLRDLEPMGTMSIPSGWSAELYDPNDTTREGIRAEMVLFGRDQLRQLMREWKPEGRSPQERFLLLSRAIAKAMLGSIGLTDRDERLESDIGQSCLRHYGGEVLRA